MSNFGMGNVYKRNLFLFIIVVILATTPVVANAQEDRQKEFVYGIAFYDGYLYGNTMVPPTVDAIYLQADVNNIIAPRHTLIYYWPLTNRYLADWATMNELVIGVLEILDGNELIATVELQKYLIQYDTTDPTETLKLHVGEDAETSYQYFKELQAQYQQDVRAFHVAQQEYRDKVSELLNSEAAKEGTLSEDDFPEPPRSVPPMTLSSQTIAEGFVISLPEGNYRIRMRLPDGRIQPDSEKRLVIFEKIKDGSSYNVVPETRWTKPEQSKVEDSAIYTTYGATIYLAPFHQGLYNEYYYRHMEDPQDLSSRRDRKIWVAFEQLEDVNLDMISKAGADTSLPLEGFTVNQLPGSARGYEVVLFNPDSNEFPSFEGFKVELMEGISGYEIRLLDDNSDPVEGSRRSIRVLYTDRAWIMYLLGVFPFVVGMVVVLYRNRRIRRIKVDE
jgi:hypothetical protein